MAEIGISSFSNTVQPICEECGFDECHAIGERRGVLKTLVPGQFKYVNSGKQKVDNILNGIKWISKGGY